MAARGRSPGFVMSEEHRTKIKNSQILNRLIRAGEGEIEMTDTQARICLGLLRKVLPDLSAVDHSGEVATPFVMRAPMPAETAEAWEKECKPTMQ